MKVAVEHTFTGPVTGSYDSTKTVLGTLMKQYNGNGSSPNDQYVSTLPSGIVNQFDVTGGTFFMPHVVQWSDDIFWIFVASNATAAVTRAIGLYEFNKNVGIPTWKGSILMSGTTIAGAKTVRGLRGFVYKHTTGTVSTSGLSTTVTGAGTGFQAEGIAAGARIGFGSTNPTQITTWYEISAIASDTSLTITTPAVVHPGTSYVIEEIRIAVATTNATLQNGGVHLIKGLNFSTFAVGGSTILEATNVDNIRASYLLKDPLINGAVSQQVTITPGTPAVFNVNNHGLQAGDMVSFSTTGTLPTGLTANTVVYYVLGGATLTTNNFTVSATLTGTAVPTTTAGTLTHTVHTCTHYTAAGIGSDDFNSNTPQQHDLYFINIDNTTNVRVSRFNLRAALTVTGGISTSAFVYKTNTATVPVTGAVSQVNNGRIFTLNHGSASGEKSLWFVNTVRVYRCKLSGLTAGASGWISDSMSELAPGGNSTYTATSAFSMVDYSSAIDRLLIPTTVTTRFSTYVAQYDVTAQVQFDRIIGANLNRLRLSATAAGVVDGLYPQAAVTLWTEGGYLFAIPNSTTTGLNWLFVYPLGADMQYAAQTNQRIITPELATLNARKLYRAYVNHNNFQGPISVGFAPDGYRLYYRTTGIDDNNGVWAEVPTSGDMSTVAPSNSIQFMLELETMGPQTLPPRIYSVSCVYEDSSQDSHYQPSLTFSSAADNRFAWRQVALWDSNIPELRITVNDASTSNLYLTDTTNSPTNGSFQYSSDGGYTWSAWDHTKNTIGNYIRYTAYSLPNNVTVRTVLTQV